MLRGHPSRSFIMSIMSRVLRVLFPNMRMPDHLAEQVDLQTNWWVLTPAIMGFRSHVLSRPRPGIRRFRAAIFIWPLVAGCTKFTVLQAVISFMFVSIGLFMGLASGFRPLPMLLSIGLSIPSLIVTLLVGAYTATLFMLARPLTFHKMSGLYWRGWRRKTMVRSNDSKSGWLSAIRAVQVLGSRGLYMEINLVLRDGSRVHVTGGGLLFFNNHLLKEATDLADFLGVELWDATGYLPANRPPAPKAQAA
jgi:hypothetical protein